MAKSGRVFLRGMTSETYGLKELRAAQLAAPRVRDDSVVVTTPRSPTPETPTSPGPGGGSAPATTRS